MLIDSPPVLAVTDPCVIAPRTDGMVVVIRMEKNNRTSITHTREQLDSYGVRLLGVIANDATEAAHRDGYHYEGYDVYYQKPAAPRQSVEPAMV